MQTHTQSSRTRTIKAGASGASALMLILFSIHAHAIDVTVQTTDCEGATGFTSFESTRLVKIQDAVCVDPTNPSGKLQQVLLRSDGSVTQFEVVTVTKEESKSIIGQIRQVKDAELENLTRPDVIVERKEVTQILQPRTSPTRSSTSRTTEPGSPPLIEVSDPPVSGTRSLTNIITDPGLSQRLVVGRVRAAGGVASLTVNGQAQQVSESGLFKANIEVSKDRTPVTIVAVDQQGQSSSVEFRLVRAQPDTKITTADAGRFGRYHALIIANSQYSALDDLVTPANDGNAIADILTNQYGFNVTKLFDATRYDMLTALNNLRRELNDNDNLLIYFAGHGAFDKANNRGHWLPTDAEHDSTANWVSTIDITDIVNAMSAKHVLVVADSCYSGALTRAENTELDPGMSEQLRDKWLTAVAQTRSRHLLTSGGVKPIVDDGGNGHSVFANALIEVLRDGTGIIESSTIYRRVKDLVATRSQELQLSQTPNYAKLKRTGHEFGEFLLVAHSDQ